MIDTSGMTSRVLNAHKKHVKEALNAGLNLIAIGNKQNYRLYKFVACGHEQLIQIGNVRNFQFRCSECLEIRRNKEAKEAGLKIIGDSGKLNHRIYQFISCGHEREMSMTHVQFKEFSCKECRDLQKGRKNVN